MLSSITLLGVKVTLNDKTELLAHLKSYLQSKSSKPLTIFTPNPEQIIEAQENQVFKDILNSADIALPDGVGVVWASKLVGSSQFAVRNKKLLSSINNSLQTTIPGIEFMEDLIQHAADKGDPVAFIGGREGVAEKALEKLKAKYSGLTGWAEGGKEFRIMNYELRIAKSENMPTYFEKLAKRLFDTGVKLVFVGLGAPKQEYFIHQLTYHLSLIPCHHLALMSVGGAFDELSGKIPRCPKWISDVGLKWLWRLILEPWRVGRQLKLIKFVWLVIKQRLNGKM